MPGYNERSPPALPFTFATHRAGSRAGALALFWQLKGEEEEEGEQGCGMTDPAREASASPSSFGQDLALP